MRGYYQIAIHLLATFLLLIQWGRNILLLFDLFISAIHTLVGEFYMDLMAMADTYISPSEYLRMAGVVF